MFGLSLETFTLLHVLISLVAIGAGLVFLAGLIRGRWFETWNVVQLVTTIATSVTGFLFPLHELLPSVKLGIISIVVLAGAVLARYAFHLRGPWRLTYLVTALIGIYLNIFVLVVQSFLKIRFLHTLAPTQTEPIFAITQGAVLILFVTAAFFGCRNSARFAKAPKAPALGSFAS